MVCGSINGLQASASGMTVTASAQFLYSLTSGGHCSTDATPHSFTQMSATTSTGPKTGTRPNGGTAILAEELIMTPASATGLDWEKSKASYLVVGSASKK